MSVGGHSTVPSARPSARKDCSSVNLLAEAESCPRRRDAQCGRDRSSAGEPRRDAGRDTGARALARPLPLGLHRRRAGRDRPDGPRPPGPQETGAAVMDVLLEDFAIVGMMVDFHLLRQQARAFR